MKALEFLELWPGDDNHESTEFCKNSGPKEDDGCTVEVAKVTSVTG